MKRLIYIFGIFFLFACDSDNANDCFQTSGSLIQKEVSVSSFDKIFVNRDVELIVKEAPVHKVVVKTGKNLFEEVKVSVENGTLTLRDDNTCNFVRNYNITKIYVSAPNITEIRSSTQYDISSDGVLTYPSLTILSEDNLMSDVFTVGDFRLQIDNDRFELFFNNSSNCYVFGKTKSLSVSFLAGNSRFEGEDFLAQNITVFHRGSNDMFVNPQQSLVGKLFSTGNLISKNRPPLVRIEALYKGRLIFE